MSTLNLRKDIIEQYRTSLKSISGNLGGFLTEGPVDPLMSAPLPQGLFSTDGDFRTKSEEFFDSNIKVFLTHNLLTPI